MVIIVMRIQPRGQRRLGLRTDRQRGLRLGLRATWQRWLLSPSKMCLRMLRWLSFVCSDPFGSSPPFALSRLRLISSGNCSSRQGGPLSQFSGFELSLKLLLFRLPMALRNIKQDRQADRRTQRMPCRQKQRAKRLVSTVTNIPQTVRDVPESSPLECPKVQDQRRRRRLRRRLSANQQRT
eukprot:COSAG02_NODE_237_length_27732_cov_9.584374_17_plen_181_part_00